jgi:hypothetical protein
MRLRHALVAVLVSSASLVSAAGCGGANAEAPESVLHSYARALEEGKSEEAYRLLSDDAKRNVSYDAFKKMVSERPEDVRELGRALGRTTTPAQVTATVTGPLGQELQLVLEKGKWKLDASALDLYAQDTPRHAIVSFVRALERKRYDVLMRFVPDSHADGLDANKLKTAWEGQEKEDMGNVLAGLKQALPSNPIEETGDRASMVYGAGTMLLVRERGLWKIEDFN